VEWVNDSSGEFDFQVSNRLEEDWVKMHEIPYSAWLGPSGHFYLLARSPEKVPPLRAQNESK
jgi:hypothetical protein